MKSEDTGALEAEIAHEQRHVDRVYGELVKASRRADMIEAEGLARGRTDRTGDIRDEEITGLFERDALVFSANRRRASLENQHEGLVFGRLDLEHPVPDQSGETREARYIGRLGVRDDEHEPLVIDWRAPAASPFYRATPVEPMGVLRRRVLRCRDEKVVGVEDDLMVAEPPEDLVVIGDGALMAALTRSRGARMRDIVATIQRHQDEAIRAPARGITEISGGPGTGKTVVALHRAAYLLYSDRRRFEAGGVLVVGPSAAYTAYIERVLPSLGEDSVILRSLGDMVDGVTAGRTDDPDTARVKGSLRIRPVLGRAAKLPAPGSPETLRLMVRGEAVVLDRRALDKVRTAALRHHQRNQALPAVLDLLADAAVRQVDPREKPEFIETFKDAPEVEAFLRAWWPPVDPREVLLWLADEECAQSLAGHDLSAEEASLLSASLTQVLHTGIWSIADIALIDDLAARLGQPEALPPEDRGFYEIEELDDLSSYGVSALKGAGSDGPARSQRVPTGDEVQYEVVSRDPRERALAGSIGPVGEYAHVLVDEAQDLSPMQWRMLGRRGRWASWTVVGDAAQSSWPDEAEALGARDEAFGKHHRQRFHMTTNYRNAREIFDYAEKVIRQAVPDADIPQAVRETEVQPVDLTATPDGLLARVHESLKQLVSEVAGSVALITPAKWADELEDLRAVFPGRVHLLDPMSAKGLEFDATIVVDPDEIVAESAGGVRVLYVALTRAAHRMHVVHVEPDLGG